MKIKNLYLFEVEKNSPVFKFNSWNLHPLISLDNNSRYFSLFFGPILIFGFSRRNPTKTNHTGYAIDICIFQLECGVSSWWKPSVWRERRLLEFHNSEWGCSFCVGPIFVFSYQKVEVANK